MLHGARRAFPVVTALIVALNALVFVVAYAAHVGGFIFGAVTARLFEPRYWLTRGAGS